MAELSSSLLHIYDLLLYLWIVSFPKFCSDLLFWLLKKAVQLLLSPQEYLPCGWRDRWTRMAVFYRLCPSLKVLSKWKLAGDDQTSFLFLNIFLQSQLVGQPTSLKCWSTSPKKLRWLATLAGCLIVVQSVSCGEDAGNHASTPMPMMKGVKTEPPCRCCKIRPGDWVWHSYGIALKIHGLWKDNMVFIVVRIRKFDRSHLSQKWAAMFGQAPSTAKQPIFEQVLGEISLELLGQSLESDDWKDPDSLMAFYWEEGHQKCQK